MLWKDLRRNLDQFANNTQVGVLPDGRPLYDNDNSDGMQFNPRSGYDMLLTNDDRDYGHLASIQLQKGWDFGLFLSGLYAYQHVMEVSPATSSRSVSNYVLHAVKNPQEPDLAVSNYERKHRFTAAIEYSYPIVSYFTDQGPWKNMKSSLGLFIESRSGQPYSWTFADANQADNLARIFGEEHEFARSNHQLFHVPKGDGTDVTLMDIDPAAFDKFLKSTGLDKYRGQIAPRNAFHSDWFSKWDTRIAQDLPNPLSGHRAHVVLDIENVGNSSTTTGAAVTTVPFPYMAPAVDVNYDPTTGKYVYSNLRSPNANRVDTLASSIGVIYDF